MNQKLLRGARATGQGGETSSACVAAILVDFFLPDSQGIETFDRLLRAAPHIRERYLRYNNRGKPARRRSYCCLMNR